MNHETTKESEKELRVILFIVMQADWKQSLHSSRKSGGFVARDRDTHTVQGILHSQIKKSRRQWKTLLTLFEGRELL
jgi:hypothetical protein